jgi:signal transduction histidine kinase
MNLMLNGIDAMKDTRGDNLLTITSAVDSGQLLIPVGDMDVGLAADHIFRAFVTSKDHGTGMRLPISRSIVEFHGGRLWVTSNAVRGATLHFSLPLAAAAEA